MLSVNESSVISLYILTTAFNSAHRRAVARCWQEFTLLPFLCIYGTAVHTRWLQKWQSSPKETETKCWLWIWVSSQKTYCQESTGASYMRTFTQHQKGATVSESISHSSCGIVERFSRQHCFSILTDLVCSKRCYIFLKVLKHEKSRKASM